MHIINYHRTQSLEWLAFLTIEDKYQVAHSTKVSENKWFYLSFLNVNGRDVCGNHGGKLEIWTGGQLPFENCN